MKTKFKSWFNRDEPGASELNALGVAAIPLAIAFVLAARRYPEGNTIQSIVGAMYIIRLGISVFLVRRRMGKVAQVLSDGGHYEAASYYQSKMVWSHTSFSNTVPYWFGMASFWCAMLFCAFRSM